MKVLVINCGSSSLKYQLIDMSNEEEICHGVIERIGIKGSFMDHRVVGREKQILNKDLETHADGIQFLIEGLMDKKTGVIKKKSEISAVGHRVVHGGEKFNSSVIINEEVMEALRACIPLAPLHNPANITGIEACSQIFADVPQIGVFDTAFHATMPMENYLYALPYEIYKEHGVRRYGFHGTSHFYVSKECARQLGKKIEDLKIVTCHLGNGGSITAVKGGKSIMTSMGLTPLEGLVMGTRCGDLDPAIPLFLQEKLNLNSKEVDTLLNKKSGVLGVSGASDMRDVEDGYMEGKEMETVAVLMYANRIKGYIANYASLMGGVDAVVFTAGVGENSPIVRGIACKDMEFMGMKLDVDVNEATTTRKGKQGEINTKDSKVKIMVIPTNEELVIARDTKRLVEAK